MVQFAVDPRDGRDFAVKFFLQQEAFKAEAALYASCFPSLRTHLSTALISRLPRTGLKSPPSHEHGTSPQRADDHQDAASVRVQATGSVCPEGEGDSEKMESSRQHPNGVASDEHVPTLERGPAPAAGRQHDPVSEVERRTGTDQSALHQVDALQHMPDAAARFLPQVEAVCDDAVDPRGRPLPPCIVMEKGESLQDWSNRAEPDLFTSLAVCPSCAATCYLASLAPMDAN